MWNKLSNFIANLGQNIQFVAFMAHMFFTAWLISRFDSLDLRITLAIAAIFISFVKEFWFDATYEKNPPQTFKDNLQDWLGYTLGAILGVLS